MPLGPTIARWSPGGKERLKPSTMGGQQEIGVLPRGKGNASQQMGRFGRRELRKCVYRWRRRGANG